jgi:hypothetical protein
MSKKGILLLADSMPSPKELARKKAMKDMGESDPADLMDDTDSEMDSGEKALSLGTMKDFRDALKSGDDEAALEHLEDLMSQLSSKE